ncbi:MAG: MFS transporter [Candidatus Vogelbacteria bacterium]|nr:MFS transporter [Candidatus Vogelbacteria bacterium]
MIDRGLPDLWFNLTFTISTVFLIFTAPFAGVLLDKHLRRITGLRWTTIITSILYGACALFALSNNNIGALILFTLGIYVYQLTFTFYTPLINDISSPEKKGRVSGYGIAANYLGQFTGLLLVLPFSNDTLNLFGGSPRAETLLPSVIAFIIVALPMLLFFEEPLKKKEVLQFASSTRELIHKTKELFLYPGVGLFILAYFFFNDAILTASNNFPIFLQQVWGVSDTTKTYILLGIIFTSAIGGLVSGFVADRFGHKRTMTFILAGWVFILPFIGFINNFTLFVVATTVMGFWFGSNWAVSRSVMAYLTPPQSNNLAFSYFNLIERTSSLVGPIVWGVVVSGLVSMGSYRYRLATLAVTVFIVLGLWALTKVKSDRPKSTSTANS